MRLYRIGDKIVSRDKLIDAVDAILEDREAGATQEETAREHGVQHLGRRRLARADARGDFGEGEAVQRGGHHGRSAAMTATKLAGSASNASAA